MTSALVRARGAKTWRSIASGGGDVQPEARGQGARRDEKAEKKRQGDDAAAKRLETGGLTSKEDPPPSATMREFKFLARMVSCL